MNQKQIIKQLRKNKTKNISIIGIIENYGIENSFQVGNSILITVKTDQLWCYPAAETEQELRKLLKDFQYQTVYFASLETWMIPIISQNKEIEWELKTERLILPKKAAVETELLYKINKEKNKTTEFIIRELKAEDADFIFAHSHYQEFTSKAYIRERIELGFSAGVIIEGELAAWGLTHDDGALGFIHVREDFRKRGLARLIMQKLISHKKENKQDIFLNVEPDNFRAKKLFFSLGFEFDRMISWIKLQEK